MWTLAPSPRSQATRQSDASLTNLESLLRAALDQTDITFGGQIYFQVVIVALALVNVALNDPTHDLACQNLARHAATTILAVVSTLQTYAIPQYDTGDAGNRETKFVAALGPHFQAMNTALITTHGRMLRSLSTPKTRWSIWTSGSEIDIARCAKELQTAYDSFSLKMSFLNDSERLNHESLGPRNTDIDGNRLQGLTSGSSGSVSPRKSSDNESFPEIIASPRDPPRKAIGWDRTDKA